MRRHDPLAPLRESMGAQEVHSTEPAMAECRGCACQFEAVPFEFFERLYLPKFCKSCCDRQEAEQKAQEEAARSAEREAKWNTICPPLYRNTDLSHPDLSRAALACVSGWNMERGIGLVGGSGKGKTRLLFIALRRAFDAGNVVRVYTHNKFSKLVMDAFMGDSRAEAARDLAALRKTDYLMIDDLGKAPSTERADAEMEELVEHRVSHSLPILWSANAGGGWLEARFGPDRGPALVRRLAQFCECVTV